MKKVIFPIIAMLFAMHAAGSTTQPVKDKLYTERGMYGTEKYQTNVLFLNGKPFTGDRQEALAYQKTAIKEPEDKNLLITEWVFQKHDSMELSQGPLMITVFVKRADGFWQEVTEFSNAVPDVSMNDEGTEIYITVASTYWTPVDGYTLWGITTSTWTRTVETYHVLGGEDQTTADWRPTF